MTILPAAGGMMLPLSGPPITIPPDAGGMMVPLRGPPITIPPLGPGMMVPSSGPPITIVFWALAAVPQPPIAAAKVITPRPHFMVIPLQTDSFGKISLY
jgi:hypothetical protein